jgi:light-regulated signal transduction histidine kinase (bacteriophytochrome)
MGDKARGVEARASDLEEDSRGGYLGYVAHEVRNPLSTALWSAELLTRMAAEERGGPRGEKLTAMCLRSLGRVRQLIEDHFLCERLDAHGIPLRPESVPLRALLEDVASRRALDLAAVQLDVDEGLTLMADRTLLDRAFDSLLAIAGREGVPVHVQAAASAGRLELRLHGKVPGEHALEDPRKGSPGDARGRSLSLPLARRVAEALGGSLELDGDVLVLALPRGAPLRPSVADPTAQI